MKHAVVTGANSFVGSAVVKELLAHKIMVTALCRIGRTANLPKSDFLKIIYFDLSDVEQMVLPNADILFHFAWLGGTKVDNRAKYEMQLKNAKFTVDIIRIMKKASIPRFVGAGSIMEYETILANQKPGNKPGLGYIYGAGKLAAHFMAQAVAAEIGIDFIWAMITNAYGSGEISTRMINTALRKCLRGEEPEFTAATQLYDFIYIDDVAKAFYAIGEKGKPFTEYLIGSGEARPLKKFLLEMREIVAPNLTFHFGNVPYTGVDLPKKLWDIKRTVSDTGFKPCVSFSEGIKRTESYLKKGQIDNDAG